MITAAYLTRMHIICIKKLIFSGGNSPGHPYKVNGAWIESEETGGQGLGTSHNANIRM